MPTSPLVAITATTAAGGDLMRVRLSDAYPRALEAAGLTPVILPPLSAPGAAEAVLDAVDGLVLSGGEDVEPALYGAVPHPKLGAIHARRDASELALLAAARERGLPTLGICRGLQLLNVAHGGTLVQDLPSLRPSDVAHDLEVRRAERVHDVAVEPGSRLAEALGALQIRTNSLHHQAIDRLGAGLRAAAHAPDGTIEAIEGTDPSWWLLGVQWHPEELVATPEPWDRALVAAFAEAVVAHHRLARVAA